MTMYVDEIIKRLELRSHPEGGFYRETFRDGSEQGERGLLTVIYYLLRAGERSAWHRVDAIEVWHHYDGAPLRLTIAQDDAGVRSLILGKDLSAGHQAHGVVPAHAWQTAESLGDWTLVGCTVAPAFVFSGFELAPSGWSPGNGSSS